MTTGNIRRAQLISPFGVGAMSVLVDGTSVITAGLDHWYSDSDKDPNFFPEEFEVHDWRLEQRLKVGSFRLPPDYRSDKGNKDQQNSGLHIPVLRFPRWHFCIYCKRLEYKPLTMQQVVWCPDSKHAGRKNKTRMSQVPFVAICSHGHISDFPFREWVHRTANPNCHGTLRLESRGGGSLEGQVVTCDSCKMQRSLQGIMDARFDVKERSEHTTLSDHLSSDNDTFLCTGSKPWLQQDDGLCGDALRGALRAAGNVYFPKVESSIYLPQKIGAVDEDLHDLFNQDCMQFVLNLIHAENRSDSRIIQMIRLSNDKLFSPFKDQQLLDAYQDKLGIHADNDTASPITISMTASEDDTLTENEEWRLPEFYLLRETPTDPLLCGVNPGCSTSLSPYLDRVRQVTTLQETRALRGFTRVRDGSLRLSEGKSLLSRKPTRAVGDDWLPAYVVKGEGIYLELNGQRLSRWESQEKVAARAALISERYDEVASARGLHQRKLTARFILLHTLAHILINQLVFSCGYSSASLRERLYASTSADKNMAGVLIYTAAGDSEGTLGGLVRMAAPDRLTDVFNLAISAARWCSTDPVCMDSGERGQGPDSCNLAACHGCALLPETSCEEFNRFLDRGLVIGTFENTGLGYFSDYQN
ncbi:DUF1998 domain-containing protein [Bifidobacterium mongoliense]|uniref:DUF1998 domain-containing protein n=1 Tax=Bifidobacterium mongoliense TaxID=518643 RepID=UPI0030EE1D2B